MYIILKMWFGFNKIPRSMQAVIVAGLGVGVGYYTSTYFYAKLLKNPPKEPPTSILSW